MYDVFARARTNLLAVHNAMNNFYNEPPFARRLAEIVNGSAVPVSAQFAVVEAVMTCAFGNPYGVSHAAMPQYEQMIKSFLPNEGSIILGFGSLPKTTVWQPIKTFFALRNDLDSFG